MDEVKSREILSGYPELSEFTGISKPVLMKLVKRGSDPLPSVKVGARKVVFVTADVLAWFTSEAQRQGNISA